MRCLRQVPLTLSPTGNRLHGCECAGRYNSGSDRTRVRAYYIAKLCTVTKAHNSKVHFSSKLFSARLKRQLPGPSTPARKGPSTGDPALETSYRLLAAARK